MGHAEQLSSYKPECQLSEIEQLRKLRSFCNYNDIKTSYHRDVLSLLFPDELKIGEFNKESVLFSPETKLSESDRILRREIMRLHGYKSRSRALQSLRRSQHDVPLFDVYFRNKQGTLLDDLNNLEMFKHLGGVSQTIPSLPTVYGEENNTCDDNLFRDQHTKHFARIVSLTMYRLAINDPEIFIERVKRDMSYYGEEFTIDKRDEKEKISKICKRYGVEKGSDKAKAIELAYAYNKYFLVAAYLHDIKTPGLGDTCMKTIILDQEGKPSYFYSEDDELMNTIETDVNSVYTGLPSLCKKHALNQSLLITLVKSLASESDPCLGGQIMKNKRKRKDNNEAYTSLLQGQSYDHDQESGTITNAKMWVNAVLTDGCRYFSKKEESPIGSFEDRLRFFAYIYTTGKSQDEAVTILHKAGINPKRMYVAIEEFTLGNNLTLEMVETKKAGEKEPVLVATRPSDVKKAILMFVMNQLFHYRATNSAPIESMMQTGIAAGIQSGILNKDIFVGKTDNQVFMSLEQSFPVIPFFHQCRGQSEILSENELRDLYSKSTVKKGIFMKQLDTSRMMQWKGGTLVCIESGEILRSEELLRRAKEGGYNPRSLIARLDAVIESLGNQKYYMVIALTSSQLEQLERIIENPNTLVETRHVMKQAIESWRIGDTIDNNSD